VKADLSHSRSVWHTAGVRFSPAAKDAFPVAGKPAASAALAGIYLFSVLVLCTGIGLGAGWVTGQLAAGAALGVAIGIPTSFYFVYRRYRDL
jgi:hypothetical protein